MKINFPIPGNDDARRAINLYCDLIKQTILDAQKNITPIDLEKPIEEKTNEKSKTKIKEESISKNEKVKTVTKKTKSIFSRIKSLTSKKTK